VKQVRKINSYIDLNYFVKFLMEIESDLNLNIDKNILTLISCRSIGFNEKDFNGNLLKFNHYLVEALEIEAIPAYEEICESLTKNKIELLYKLLDGIKNKTNQEKVNAPMDIRKSHEFEYVSEQILNCYMKHIGNDRGLGEFTLERKKLFEKDGYLIIENYLNNDQVEKLSKLTLHIAQVEDEQGFAFKYGDKGNNLQRVYNLISKHPIYIELLELDIVKEILDYYFHRDTLHHKYVLSSFISNILHPGSEAQQLHVDGLGSAVPSLPPYPTRLNINFLLTDWTMENGATSVLPGSHKLNRIPKYKEKESELVRAIAPKGSIIIWTGHTWHRSEANNSNKPRFGCFACFAASQFKELTTEEEHLQVVDKHIMDNLSPEMRFIIGLDRGIKKGAYHRIDFSNTPYYNMGL
jgi:ectoine hydroxylase-related dioxygenase (phytanoyl-CoA dioxygenase family)